jgi:hypothetical protein
MSLAIALITERKYDKPRISTIKRIIGRGKNMIVHGGENPKIGISRKNTDTSIKDNIAIAKVETTGKNSFSILMEFIIPLLLTILVNPPAVPLTKT